MVKLRAPFPWFGGKSRAAPLIWCRLGTVNNYVEPFFGSGAVLLANPTPAKLETVNDRDGFVANFWRAVQRAPDSVAEYADWPVNEADLHARHAWLVARSADLLQELEGDPDYCDTKVAGWWLWGISTWIGGGWCYGKGGWTVIDKRLVRAPSEDVDTPRIPRTRPHLGTRGMGVHGVRVQLHDWMGRLRDRMRRVRVCCGDWQRVVTPTVTTKAARNGITAVVLDPPYSHRERDPKLYRIDQDVAQATAAWARAHGDDPALRIVLCGYEGEHEMPGWTCERWKTQGGYGAMAGGRGRANASRETLWFSPHCLQPEAPSRPHSVQTRHEQVTTSASRPWDT